MTGGNQLKLSAIVNGTAVRRRDPGRAPAAGVVVGGTSAGASIQSSHMVAFGAGGATPKQRMTQVAAGPRPAPRRGHRPALRPAQPLRPAADARRPEPRPARHRRRRGHRRRDHRGGRRARSCASSAAARSPSSTAATSSPTPTRPGAPRRCSPPAWCCTCCPPGRVVRPDRPQTLVRQAPVVDPDEAEELAVAGRDLKRLARDIAAGDVSPTVLRRRRARQQPRPRPEGRAVA